MPFPENSSFQLFIHLNFLKTINKLPNFIWRSSFYQIMDHLLIQFIKCYFCFTQIHFYNFFEFQYSNYQSSLQISLHNQNFIISDCLEQCSCYCFIILYKNSFYFPEYLGKCICFNCILYLTNIANFYQNLLG